MIGGMPARLAFAAVVAVLAIAAPVRADELLARAAMDRGVAALAQGNPQLALDEFEHAIAQVPEAPVPYRFAGEALERLGRWDEAVARYRTYLNIRPDSRDGDDVRARIARITSRHLQGVLVVRCAPTGAQVDLDGTGIGATPVERAGVARGAHVVEVRAAGHLARRLDVTVTSGTTTVVDCELTKLPPPSPPPPGGPVVKRRPEQQVTAPPAPWYRRPWVWITAGAVVVAGGAAVTYLALPDRPDTAGGDIHFPRAFVLSVPLMSSDAR